MSEKSICLNCKHAMFVSYGDSMGECRRHAPRPTESGGEAFWPFVHAGDWCGEWKGSSEQT